MSTAARVERAVEKEPVMDRIDIEKRSALATYQDFFVGSTRMTDLLKYEFATMFLVGMPGALGLLLRKMFYPALFQHYGKGVVLGKEVAFRHPGRISIGDRTAIDDGCLIDAKDAGPEGIHIGRDVLIARDTIVQGKGSYIKIGDKSSIGSQCRLSSPGGMEIGESVMIAAHSLIGGGRYRTEDVGTAIKDQELYTRGPVVIEDDVWLGAGVIVQDGVRIGKGSVVGSGGVVKEDIPPYTIAVPHQRLVMIPREK